MAPIVVCALYKFVTLDNHTEIQQPLLAAMKAEEVRGTLILANEGINGTVAGTRDAIDALLAWLRKDLRLTDVDTKESFTDVYPFKRTKVKLKKEIVTMRVEGVDPLSVVGTYCTPHEWNELLADPEVLLVDTRNHYEYQVGTFKNAVNPETASFSEFPQYIADNFDKNKHKKIAMFCTGGIRCEKSTAYVKELGFDEVYHLKGGILKYLEEMPVEESVWEGECFVFDDRITVDHHLQKGQYDQCNACRMPITEDEKKSQYYVKGVSCPHCFDKHSEKQKARFAEREKQMCLAQERGEVHIGGAVAARIVANREAKWQRKNDQRDAEKES
ncbi:MAG TPA: rhodanese-related sulfurtransferase [Leucothrix mucor]|nr:rhodanese-related sulfurtransferase [Leucothrix mucor]